MSSEDNTSDNSVIGHHETWEDFHQSQAKEIKKLEARIERQQRQIDHLEWHCYVYQATLQKVAEGMHIHAQSLQEFGKREQPVCPHCEREELLKKVADLEAKEAARGSATGSQSMETQL